MSMQINHQCQCFTRSSINKLCSKERHTTDQQKKKNREAKPPGNVANMMGSVWLQYGVVGTIQRELELLRKLQSWKIALLVYNFGSIYEMQCMTPLNAKKCHLINCVMLFYGPCVYCDSVCYLGSWVMGLFPSRFTKWTTFFSLILS